MAERVIQTIPFTHFPISSLLAHHLTINVVLDLIFFLWLLATTIASAGLTDPPPFTEFCICADHT
jgi:hypothetical protein